MRYKHLLWKFQIKLCLVKIQPKYQNWILANFKDSVKCTKNCAFCSFRKERKTVLHIFCFVNCFFLFYFHSKLLFHHSNNFRSSRTTTSDSSSSTSLKRLSASSTRNRRDRKAGVINLLKFQRKIGCFYRI